MDENIFITTEEDLKNQISDAQKIVKIIDKLSINNNQLSYQEIKDLKQLSSSILNRANARLADLYPQYRKKS